MKKIQIGQVLFSGGTYQVEVFDPKEDEALWPFFQLDDQGKILDHFCTCKRAEEGKECRHLKEAVRGIFGGTADPLHVRFRASLWNQLCVMGAGRLGFEPQGLKKSQDGVICLKSSTGKELFWIRPRTAEAKRRLSEIVFERVVETEETSLKFSKLPPDELKLWREGRPSEELLYELSLWSDLAKWWMELQEAGLKYEITFDALQEALPRWIKVKFSGVEFRFYIAEANWERVIPSLSSVESPLRVYDMQGQEIEQITYDRERKVLHVVVKEGEEKRPALETVLRVGEWEYAPGRGFFPAKFDPLLLEREVSVEKMGVVFHHHRRLLEKYLSGETIHRGHYELRYHLELTQEKGLMIRSYLFEPGDLQQEFSARFNSWVYVFGKGFYQVREPLSAHEDRDVPLEEVAGFIEKHRKWLSEFPGFEMHLAAIEARLTYEVCSDGHVRFTPHFELLEEEQEAVDVGEWIYIQGKGFYPKMTRAMETFFKEGAEVAPEQVGGFIQRYKEELEQTKGFFTAENPLERAGLVIALKEDQRIVVTPHYDYKPGYDPRRVRFFGDYIYSEGVGFSWIPQEMRLPDNYAQERVISSFDVHQFVSFELKALHRFILSIDPRLTAPKYLVLRLNEIKRSTKTKVPTWIVDLTYESNSGEIDAYEVFQAMNGKRRFLFSSAGLLFFPQIRFNWLKGLSKRKFLDKGKKIRLTTLEWIRLGVLEEIEEPRGDFLQARRSRKLLEEFRNFEVKETLNLEGLLSKLRPYQETGTQWLWFLYCTGLSGLLCDDMGLGKTHQAMALLAAAKNHAGAKGGKYLVVCPTSVLYHWEDLLKRFFPGMRVALFHGVFRRVPEEFDLILTSYGIVRTEAKFLSSISFDIAVYDEIQSAKNPKSQTHKVLKALDAKMRVGLTGTPIENRLLDLKALYDIVVPTYLPHEASFRQLFVNPIEKGHDEERLTLFRKLISPFILRRKKSEVLLELPEKIEEIALCPLSNEQRALYNQVVTEHKEALLNQLENPNEPVPYLHIFSLLSTLKQICDHPALFHKRFAEGPRHKSGKWELFVELLQETLDSGQKLVVFSQYLGMLDIIEAYLKENKIKYAGIRGSTRDRKEQMERFKKDPKCSVFVASLKAAGVGVDLVAASVVIHYDRWWNPAKENQATDRVHRIGQSRGVQVFKMVTKGTIEEHIHALIEKKVFLAEQAIGYDDQDQIKTLERQDLINLLRALEVPVESEEEL